MDTLVSLESVPSSELTSTQVDGAWEREIFESTVVALSPEAIPEALCMLSLVAEGPHKSKSANLIQSLCCKNMIYITVA